MQLKLCINCIYHKKEGEYEYKADVCTHPSEKLTYYKISPVTGIARPCHASLVRVESDLCGFSANWFVEKPSAIDPSSI